MKRILLLIIICFLFNTSFSQIIKVGEKDRDGVRCLSYIYSEKELYEVLDFLIENAARTKMFDVKVVASNEIKINENSCGIFIDEEPFFATVPPSSWARIKHIGDTIKLVSKIKTNKTINDIIAYSDTMSSRYEPFLRYENQTYTIRVSPNNRLSYYKRLFEYLKQVTEATHNSDNIRLFIFAKESMDALCTFLTTDFEPATKADAAKSIAFADTVIRYAIENTYYVPYRPYGITIQNAIDDFDYIQYQRDSLMTFFYKYRNELLNQLKTNVFYPEKYWEFYKNNMMDFTAVDTAGIPQFIKDEVLKQLENPWQYSNPYFVKNNKEQYPDIEEQMTKMWKIYKYLGEYIENGATCEEALARLYKDSFPYILNDVLIWETVLYIKIYNDKEFLDVLLENRSEWEKYDKYSYKELDKYLNK